MNDYLNGGINSNSNMSYADYLDLWIKEYCEVEYKYTTTKRYKESLGAIKNGYHIAYDGMELDL